MLWSAGDIAKHGCGVDVTLFVDDFIVRTELCGNEGLNQVIMGGSLAEEGVIWIIR